MYNGALADMQLATSPWNLGRYTYAGGNPTTLIEYDGHMAVRDIDGGGGGTGGSNGGSDGVLATGTVEQVLGSGIVLDGTLVLAPNGAELDSVLDAAHADFCPGSEYGEWGCGNEPDPSSFRGALSTLAHPFRAHPEESDLLDFICTEQPDWCPPPGEGDGLVEPVAMEMGLPVGSAARLALARALTAGANAKQGYHVYFGIRDNKQVYVGITNNLGRRASEHRAGYGFEQLREVTRVPVTRGEARAIEQALINRNPQFVNVRNSISARHPYYERAGQWGEAWLKARGL
jgi:hypothetical protein